MKQLLLWTVLAMLLCTGCTADDTTEPPTPARGETVVIALLDTGVSTDAIQSDGLHTGYNYVRKSDDTEDRINHGTAVASIILGCESAEVPIGAPDAQVVPLVITDKIDGDVTSVSAEVLAQAIRDSVDLYDADIINVSLGIKADIPALYEAVVYASEQGALLISAVGNEGNSTDRYYPASYVQVLAVGSHDKHQVLSDFSQNNGTADILAPGEDIWLASRTGKTYGTRGTSFSAGYVSAAAAVLWAQAPTATAEEIVEKILSCAQTVDGQKILDIGWTEQTQQIQP